MNCCTQVQPKFVDGTKALVFFRVLKNQLKHPRLDIVANFHQIAKNIFNKEYYVNFIF
jgi:hypothetical protein